MRPLISVIALLTAAWFPQAGWASNYPLDQVLPEQAAKKLVAQGIKTTKELVIKAGKRKARQALAKATKLPRKQLDEWVDMSDLMRIRGVGPEMAKLLRACKVMRLSKLRRQAPARLHKRMLAVNKQKRISGNPPHLNQVRNWIGQAKKLRVLVR
jgi:predicted flap endonuclease-1-like 5' DNA nuclease